MRKRCTWNTIEKINHYELQTNEYNEIRVIYFGKVFRTFSGQNKFRDADFYWNNVKLLNS